VLPLIRCRDCDSKLLQLERMWMLGDGRRIADRRCPECDAHDSVIVGELAAQLWLAREERLRVGLMATADDLGCGAELPANLSP
jgi:hypothetical protein